MSIKTNLAAATQGSGNVLRDFTTFIEESSIIDTAVGIIIGQSFKLIVDSFVNDVMSPVLSKLFYKPGSKLEDMYIVLGRKRDYNNIDDAQRSGAHVLRYGKFIQSLLKFILQALVIFFLIRGWTYLKSNARALVSY